METTPLGVLLARDNVKARCMIFRSREAFQNVVGDPHLGEPRGMQCYRLSRRTTTRNHPLAWMRNTEADCNKCCVFCCLASVFFSRPSGLAPLFRCGRFTPQCEQQPLTFLRV